MTADDLIACLGKGDDHPDIQRLLTRLGAKKPPKGGRGDTGSRVEVRHLGVTLEFAPADGDPRHGQELVRVVLQGQAQGGAKPFAGALPFGLAFADPRKDARKKVGPPMHMSDELNRDAWDYQTHTMTADYAQGRGSIARLSLSMPFDPDDDDD